jgi:hypothetical protein
MIIHLLELVSSTEDRGNEKPKGSPLAGRLPHVPASSLPDPVIRGFSDDAGTT